MTKKIKEKVFNNGKVLRYMSFANEGILCINAAGTHAKYVNFYPNRNYPESEIDEYIGATIFQSTQDKNIFITDCYYMEPTEYRKIETDQHRGGGRFESFEEAKKSVKKWVKKQRQHLKENYPETYKIIDEYNRKSEKTRQYLEK